ncbi:hypothetical protein LTR56_027703 [Elasticomyces elasticus]|nr:hypothetical protein LTR56_027703 [Elasticomyces elasticus]KAK3616287.1 hypothetical protein LTR22_027123 [Elasticomyces elasticus]KAK4904159.1 hypothetical protein LTR49_026334 [Elasticomyces elasticus]KAK5734476.1 hypothetical protein LTS12_026695 [Elasticomyces elasticus]
MSTTTRDRTSYGVGIVCALPLEKAAVMGMLDDEHPKLRNAEGDTNDYTLGRIGEHDVVVACLPAGGTGKASAATVAANMQRSFRIRIGLMVGIGGGVPSKSRDVRLGDVVVSQPTEQHGGVVQWDFGKMEKGGVFRRTGMLNKPPAVLLNALAGLQARHEVEEPQMSKHIDGMLFRRPRMAPAYGHQGGENDWLFEADYDHAGEETCEACDRDRLVRRPARTGEREIVVHPGNIASGDEVMKDGRTRDRIAASEKVICFEMEAAGLMDHFPCLVIRGICDYADSHKHKRWQRYAAAAAAAYTKELLLAMPAAENLPFEENPQFTGRRSELEALEHRLFDQPCRRRVAVVGLGGIGKTQVVLSFAYSVWKKHLELSIIWVPAISAEMIERAFEEIAELLELPAPSDGKSTAEEVVCKYLSTPAAGSWLMIVDNADDASILNGDAQRSGLLRYLPRSNQGLTLFTTRNSEIAQSLAGSDVVEVTKLSNEDATSMLTRAVVRKESLSDTLATSQLLVELDNLPLAIAQAAAYINVNQISASKYLDLIKSTEEDVVEVMSTQIGDSTGYRQTESAVATTWIISFQQIVKRDAHAAELLRYMSCIEWRAIPESILPQIKPQARMTRAVGLLCSYSFLARRQDEEVYDMHRLVHLATRIWDERYGSLAETRQRAVTHLSTIFPFGEHEKRNTWRAYLPHAARMNQDVTNVGVDGEGELYKLVGYCLHVDGRLKDAVLWLEESCYCFGKIAESASDRLASQHVLAIAY